MYADTLKCRGTWVNSVKKERKDVATEEKMDKHTKEGPVKGAASSSNKYSPKSKKNGNVMTSTSLPKKCMLTTEKN